MSVPVLVSACLLNHPVRYDGQSKGLLSPWLAEQHAQGWLHSLCPEVAGGLPIPRAPAERQGERVINVTGQDVSAAFERGAQQALALCQANGIRFALLKEGSPSCGSSRIYNGLFNGQCVAGEGVTTALLRRHGIAVFNEHQLVELARALASFE